MPRHAPNRDSPRCPERPARSRWRRQERLERQASVAINHLRHPRLKLSSRHHLEPAPLLGVASSYRPRSAGAPSSPTRSVGEGGSVPADGLLCPSSRRLLNHGSRRCRLLQPQGRGGHRSPPGKAGHRRPTHAPPPKADPVLRYTEVRRGLAVAECRYQPMVSPDPIASLSCARPCQNRKTGTQSCSPSTLQLSGLCHQLSRSTPHRLSLLQRPRRLGADYQGIESRLSPRQDPHRSVRCQRSVLPSPASACNSMNWFKCLCPSEQYRLATLGTLRR